MEFFCLHLYCYSSFSLIFIQMTFLFKLSTYSLCCSPHQKNCSFSADYSTQWNNSTLTFYGVKFVIKEGEYKMKSIDKWNHAITDSSTKWHAGYLHSLLFPLHFTFYWNVLCDYDFYYVNCSLIATIMLLMDISILRHLYPNHIYSHTSDYSNVSTHKKNSNSFNWNFHFKCIFALNFFDHFCTLRAVK
jgi:hypothetical protein